ncbi:hypothetical protein ABZ897_16315 [Nonomuraea sp. NPDC046802]|uniref:hypothetical protein n=1 Tax=Nonomuraea sp. NPDC046802 TaxID=3154919 RepID=UPI0033C38AD5
MSSEQQQPVNPRIQARLSDDMAAWLNERSARMHSSGHNEQAKIELSLWRDALALELRRIRLALNQAMCIADVLNGHLMSPGLGYRPGLVYAELYDAFDIANDGPVPGYSSYGKKWDIDEQQLLNYLGKLSPVADHALLDAMCRWWELQSREQGLDDAKAFAHVGIRIIDQAEPEQPRA